MPNESSFQDLKSRLDEIVELVSDDSMSLDEALKLYEEAVSIGLEATNLLEQNISDNNQEYDEKNDSMPQTQNDSSSVELDA